MKQETLISVFICNIGSECGDEWVWQQQGIQSLWQYLLHTEHAGVIAVMEIILVIGKEAKSNHREDILITSIILFVTTPHQDPRQLYVIYVIDG